MDHPVKSTILVIILFIFVSAQDLVENTDRPEGLRKKLWTPAKPYIPDVREGATVQLGEDLEDGAVLITPTSSDYEKAIFSSSGEAESSVKLQMIRFLANISKETGESVKMRCEARGVKEPQFVWYKNEAPLEAEKGKLEVRKYISEAGHYGSRLRITDLDTHDTGYYKCMAVADDQRVESSGILMVRAGRVQPPATIPNFPPMFPHFPALGGRCLCVG